jgi:hypothetical protein
LNRLFLYIALALGLAMTGIHVFIGGRLIAAPLLASNLADLPKFTLYLCWHGITIVLGGLALAFADGLFWRKRRDVVLIASVIAGLFAFLSLSIGLFTRQSPLDLPQWLVLGPMAVAGFLALHPRK